MHFTFLHLFLLLLGGLLWWLWKRVCQYFERQAHELFLKAQREEEQGLYAEACYTYGVALLNGVSNRHECQERIRHLWRTYGPFDYSHILAELEDPEESCGLVGHFATLSEIDEALFPEARRFCWTSDYLSQTYCGGKASPRGDGLVICGRG